MNNMTDNQLTYTLMDPTGNITALVESAVEVDGQPQTAALIMSRHPEVEQVGFITFYEPESVTDVQVGLRMAGGEFCGNASMCAAALYLIRKGLNKTASNDADTGNHVSLRVSGVQVPVGVDLHIESDQTFNASIILPPPVSVGAVDMRYDDVKDRIPVVKLQGISHAVICSDSPFFRLRDERYKAEQAVRRLCSDLSAEGLGFMFLSPSESKKDSYVVTPLVYIPGSDTVFWENSCASGSAAIGMYLAEQLKRDVNADLLEPGGLMHIRSRADGSETVLCGKTKVIQTYSGYHFD